MYFSTFSVCFFECHCKKSDILRTWKSMADLKSKKLFNFAPNGEYDQDLKGKRLICLNICKIWVYTF